MKIFYFSEREFFRFFDPNIPYVILYGATLVFIGGISFIFLNANNKIERIKKISQLFLIVYYILVICSTVVFRPVRTVRKFDFTPFWSYTAISEGKYDILIEVCLNTLIFIPIGFAICFAVRHISLKVVIGYGLLLSAAIELLQFAFFRGFSEFDDLFHNVMGCLIGFCVFSIIKKVSVFT